MNKKINVYIMNVRRQITAIYNFLFPACIFMFSPLTLYCQQNNPIHNTTSINALMGKIYYNKNPEFQRVPVEVASRSGMYLRGDTLASFLEMHKAAKKDQITLRIISAGRNFFDQKRIWERKWNGKQPVEGKKLNKAIKDPSSRALFILRYSSMPGTSRHHWGTDIDLNSLTNGYFRAGKGKKVYDWLQKNAARYGFCQPYTSKKSGRTGYQEEMWHWSYVPIAKPYLKLFATQINDRMISGFDGSSSAIKIKVIDKYVLGVSSKCK